MHALAGFIAKRDDIWSTRDGHVDTGSYNASKIFLDAFLHFREDFVLLVKGFLKEVW